MIQTISERRTKIKITKEEINQAKNQGISCPKAGLPDFKAIEEVFGFTPEDIHGTWSNHIRIAKVNNNRHSPSQ